jgi:hypothetical protein
MKLALALASLFTLAALAQQPQLRPTPPELQPAQPAPAPQEGLGLIPEAPEPAPKPRGTALVEPRAALERATGTIDRTAAVQNEMAERVRLRELIVKVRKEPKVAAELDRAETARTDLEKREALKNYYTLLYDRVAKLEPKLKTRVTELQRRSINRLTQTRLDPTEPLERE